MKTENKQQAKLDSFQLQQITRADLNLHQVSRNKANPINIQAYPFDCIGLLKFTNPKSGMTLNGTAFLISCDLILTSAQNIYNKKDQSYFSDFQYISTTLEKQHHSIKIRQFRVDHDYVSSKNQQENLSKCYGLLKLDKPIIKDKYFQIRYNFAQQNKPIILYGFPKPLHQMELFGKEGKIQKIQEALFLHSIITQTGQSGSPIFIKQKDSYFLVGLHLGISHKRGIGILLNKNIVNILCKWQRQMMVSQLKFAAYQQQNLTTEPQKYSVYFQQCRIQQNDLLSNWSPLNIDWHISPQSSDKFEIVSNKLTRLKKSLFDDRHKQATSLQPLPTSGKFYIQFKIIEYGNSIPFDSIYFGIITQKYTKEDYSDGRSKGSMAYLSSPNNFSNGQTGLGTILMDGRQFSHGQDLYIQKGGCVRLQINISAGQITWNNGKKLVNLKLSSKFSKHPLHLFISLCKDKSCVSWRSNDNKVWH